MDTWIQTYTGKRFDFIEPRPEMVDIIDIAHALSNQCRFNGHCREFYSVAQHSVFVAHDVRRTHPDLGLEALLHDAAEAYIGDMVSPLKAMMPQYKEMEHKVEKVIADRFGLEFPFHPIIKRADMQMLMDEKNALHVKVDNMAWVVEQTFKPTFGRKIKPMAPHAAEALFLNFYRRLIAHRGLEQREY